MANSQQIPDENRLRTEVASLFQYILRLKEEIAQIHTHPDEEHTHFETVSGNLDEIVAATEGATHTILEAVEDIEKLVDEIREANPDDASGALCDKITDKTTAALEACTFQDITGQRVSKIVKSIQFVEDRVNAITNLWGRDDIERFAESMPVQGTDPENAGEVLAGPAMDNGGISQDEIDKLFD